MFTKLYYLKYQLVTNHKIIGIITITRNPSMLLIKPTWLTMGAPLLDYIPCSQYLPVMVGCIPSNHHKNHDITLLVDEVPLDYLAPGKISLSSLKSPPIFLCKSPFESHRIPWERRPL